MELRQLQTFRAVADHESFTRAARKLHLAQSSVSAQIKALEEELGVRLFDRIGRRVLITDAGTTLYAYARRMEEMSREVRNEISAGTQSRGSLTVRVPETLARVYMPRVIQAFHQHHPRVGLEFINCSDTRLREELNSGRIDLAFLLTDAIHLKEVNIKMLGSEKLILVSGPAHPLAERKNISLKHLDGHTLVLPMTD